MPGCLQKQVKTLAPGAGAATHDQGFAGGDAQPVFEILFLQGTCGRERFNKRVDGQAMFGGYAVVLNQVIANALRGPEDEG